MSKSTEDNMKDSLDVVTAIMSMHLLSKSKEDYEAFKEMREAIYADYDEDDLKRMIRNISRFFMSAWCPWMISMEKNPMEAWQMTVQMFNSGENPFFKPEGGSD